MFLGVDFSGAYAVLRLSGLLVAMLFGSAFCFPLCRSRWHKGPKTADISDFGALLPEKEFACVLSGFQLHKSLPSPSPP